MTEKATSKAIWTKPSVQGLDAWEKFGNPGWDWEALAPYYRKIERCAITCHLNCYLTNDTL